MMLNPLNVNPPLPQVYDTQMLVGGGKYQLNEEEYVFGALTIYIDVIQIFLYLLEIFGRR